MKYKKLLINLIFFFVFYEFRSHAFEIEAKTLVEKTEIEKEIPVERINVGIIFTKVSANSNLIDKFKLCVNSMLKYSTVDINFYIIGDIESQHEAKKIFSKIKNTKVKYEVNKYI